MVDGFNIAQPLARNLSSAYGIYQKISAKYHANRKIVFYWAWDRRPNLPLKLSVIFSMSSVKQPAIFWPGCHKLIQEGVSKVPANASKIRGLRNFKFPNDRGEHRLLVWSLKAGRVLISHTVRTYTLWSNKNKRSLVCWKNFTEDPSKWGPHWTV